MISEERKQTILSLLLERNIVNVSELSKRFKTSEVTIRRDLKQLEDEGILKRTHGGAVRLQSVKDEPIIDELELRNNKQKIAIAEEASKFIEDNDTILIDSSSTGRKLALLIKNSNKNITLVTNSFKTLWEMIGAKNVEMIHLGGNLRESILSSVGPLTVNALKMIRVDKAFIGINGIDADSAYTTPNMIESDVKKAMIKSAKQVFIIADSTKFDKTYLSIVCDFNNIDYLITDSGIPKRYKEFFQTINSKLVIAELPKNEQLKSEGKSF